MERSEPTLVPEWLKSAGSLTGGISTLQSDDHSAPKLVRNKSFVNGNSHDSGRSSSSDRTTSSYFRQSSSGNGSVQLRSYSSFGRNQRDWDWEKDTYDSRGREKSTLGDHRNWDFSDPLKNTLSSKFERDGLRRSQSISGKHGDTWQKKVVTDLSNSRGSNRNGLLTKGSSNGSEKKTNFERDFPSLGAEERSVAPEAGRVPSPGLSTVTNSLPFGTSMALGGEKWTSALAEVPVSVGSSGTNLSVQQATPTPTSMALGTSTSLNMAEAVAQGPIRSQSTSQLPVGTQRLDELAIKQSRQLIPVTPSVPKILVSMSDKQKVKTGLQQYPITSSLPVGNPPKVGPAKGDVSKASNVGKLHVLKPVRERNGVAPVVKETVSPTSGTRAASSTNSDASLVSASAATRSPPKNPVFHSSELKLASTVLEKLHTSQAQSRKDFFNLMRKKSIPNSSSVADSSTANSSFVLDTGIGVSPSSDKLAETEVVAAPDTQPRDMNISHKAESTVVDDSCDCGDNENNHLSSYPIITEEEEAAFLRSLGWEENSDEGGLTEEEISAFYKDVTKYIDSKPSKNLLRVQQKLALPFDSQVGGIDGISSGPSSSNAKLES